MQKEIEYVSGVRQSVVRAVRYFNNEQMNAIPHGFHNNLIWHLAHMVASQQDFFYVQAGVEIKMDTEMYHNFRIGTRPLRTISDSEVTTIKNLALSSIAQLQMDYEEGMFKNISNLKDILTHFVFHEGMHMAYILSIRRLIIYDRNG